MSGRAERPEVGAGRHRTLQTLTADLARAALLLMILPAVVQSQDPSMALVGGQVVDGYGGPPIQNAAVVIGEGRVLEVGPAEEVEVPSGVDVVDTSGMTVLPGLFDMHVHLQLLGHGDYERWHELYGEQFASEVMPRAAEQLLSSGVTSARDLGAPLEDILEVRSRIEAGDQLGPRLFVSGPFLQDEPYEEYEERYRWGIDGPDDAREKVAHLADAGVDVIKLVDQDWLAEDEVEALAAEAREANLPVVAHAHRAEEIRVGLRHGVDNFEHTGLGTAPGYPDDVLADLRERNADLYWTPTISPLLVLEYTAERHPARINAPHWQNDLPDQMAKEIRESLSDIRGLPYYAHFPRRIPHLERKFNQLRETGVQLLIGTDSGIPSMFHTDSVWREMALWVDLGVPAMEVIQAATLWPARFLGVEDELGTLAPGKLADIVAVEGNPLEHMSLMSQVRVVVKGGERIR